MKKFRFFLFISIYFFTEIHFAARAEDKVNANLLKQSPLANYGFNGEISKSPNWSNTNFLDAVAKLNLGIIRYPGGSVANIWDWKTGQVLNQEVLYTKQNNKILNNKYTSEHDIEDLRLLVNKTGCDVIFILNMVTKNLEDQISMLETAQAMGIPVKWVELGNEFYLKENSGKHKFETPSDYGKTAEQWIDVIKSKFPTAKIAVIGSDEQDWNQDVLKNAAEADAITYHIYPFPKDIIDESGINFSKLYENVQVKLRSFNSPLKTIPVWVSEYNIHWAFLPNKTSIEKHKIQNYAFTWGQALASLLMTSEITSFSNNIEMIINHGLANWPNFAAINVYDKGNFRMQPNGIGMKVWLDAIKDMNYKQKISISSSFTHRQLKDYEIIAWKFSNSINSNLLFVNLTDSSIKINLSNLLEPKNYTALSISADKNMIINKENIGVKTQLKKITNEPFVLEKYSIVTIKN